MNGASLAQQHYPGRGRAVSKPCRGEGEGEAMRAHLIVLDKRFQRTVSFTSDVVGPLEYP